MSTRLVAAALLLAAVPAAQAICTANASPPVPCDVKVPRHGKVRITRDDYGVPHVEARSLYGDQAALFRTFTQKPMRLGLK